MFDFFDASKRHYNDAKFLQNDNRLPNAAQLFGFAAECGMKALIEKISGQSLDLKYYKHVDGLIKLLPSLSTLANGRMAGTYLAMISGFNAFGTWTTHHRYMSETDIPLADLPTWAAASAEVQKMLQQAQLDGVLK